MDAIQLLRELFREAHGVLEATMADVTAEHLHWAPPGKAHPISGLYAHTVMGEDGVLSGMVKHSPPLFATSWAGRTGVSEIPPQAPPWGEWARRIQVDLPALREYAQAVYAATDQYLALLKPEDLEAEMEVFGRKHTLGNFLGTILLAHTNWHIGEISTTKGLKGAKGYPF